MTSYKYNNCIIYFNKIDNKLDINIITNRSNLTIKSINNNEDFNYFKRLFQDEESIKMYATGLKQTDEEIKTKFETWSKRFKNNDPFSSFMVFNSNKEFIGFFVIGHGDGPGESEIGILLLKDYWGRGYGKEILNSFIKDYTQCLSSENYLLDGKPLYKIMATARLDNEASNKMLSSCGFIKIGEKISFGRQRNVYQFNVINK